MRKGLSSQEKQQQSAEEAATGKAVDSQLTYKMPFHVPGVILRRKPF